MYAVFEDGTRQYRVSEGDLVRLDYRDVEVGSELELSRILVFQADSEVHIGQPVIEGAKVIAEVVDFPTEKVTIQKFRRRKNYRRFRGHRQPYTLVEILYLLLPGMERPAPGEEEEEDDTTSEEGQEAAEGGEESGEESERDAEGQESEAEKS
jgi:large subunit ribosomal protein L21